MIEDHDSDSEFNPDKDYEDRIGPQVWDDEERVVNVEEGQEAGHEEGEAEVEEAVSNSHMSAKDEKSAAEDEKSQTSEIVARKRRLANKEAGDSQASSVRREQLKKRNMKAKKFFDEEAELGSDDEENDDICKKINKEDFEENEEGLDADLEEFVDNGDHELIEDDEQNAFAKFQQDMYNDDRAQTV